MNPLRKMEIIGGQIFGFEYTDELRFVVVSAVDSYYRYISPFSANLQNGTLMPHYYQVTPERIYLALGNQWVVFSRDLRTVIAAKSLSDFIPGKIEKFVVIKDSLIFLTLNEAYIYDKEYRLKKKIDWQQAKWAEFTENGFYSHSSDDVCLVTPNGLEQWNILDIDPIVNPLWQNHLFVVVGRRDKRFLVIFDVPTRREIARYSLPDASYYEKFVVFKNKIIIVTDDLLIVIDLATDNIQEKRIKITALRSSIVNLWAFEDHFSVVLSDNKVCQFSYDLKLLATIKTKFKPKTEFNSMVYTML